MWAFPPSRLVDKLVWLTKGALLRAGTSVCSWAWTELHCVSQLKAWACLFVDVSRILVGPEWSCVCLEYTNILNLRFQWCILLVRSMSLVLWCPMWKSNSSVEVSLFQLIDFVTREPSVSCTLREAIVRSWEYSHDPGRQTGWTWESVLWVSYTFSSLCFQVTQQIPAICQNNSGIRVAQWLSGFLKWG